MSSFEIYANDLATGHVGDLARSQREGIVRLPGAMDKRNPWHQAGRPQSA
jgi:hypothetical protein